jgi:putative colanic acid biosysnthesis UDP-glucose lipid carrier transferase
MKSNRYFFKVFALITEFIIINLSCKLAYFFRFEEFGSYEDNYLSFFIVFNLAWIGSSLFTNSYESSRLLSLKMFLRSLFSTVFLHLFVTTLYIVSVKAQELSRLYLIYTYSTALLSIISFRSVLILAYRYYNSMTYNIRKIALIGDDESITELYNFFDRKNTTVYRFLEYFDPKMSEQEKAAWVAETIEEVKSFCLQEKVNEIYLSLPLTSEEMIEELQDFADDNFIYFRIVTNFNVLRRRQVNVDFFGHIPIISLRKEPLKVLINRVVKRGFDIAFSLGVILLVFPILMPIVAILIKLESPGPVFFRQLRTGKNGRGFTVYKFRTMKEDEGANGKGLRPIGKRITKVGAFLRRSSLDEFPQFINVLKGDMSVVGPRPHVLKQTDEYSRIINKYLLRHFITPGITGYAQVNGYRGETENPEMMRKRVEYDSWYIENWSLFLDIKIVLLTVWNVLRGEENAY